MEETGQEKRKKHKMKIERETTNEIHYYQCGWIFNFNVHVHVHVRVLKQHHKMPLRLHKTKNTPFLWYEKTTLKKTNKKTRNIQFTKSVFTFPRHDSTASVLVCAALKLFRSVFSFFSLYSLVRHFLHYFHYISSEYLIFSVRGFYHHHFIILFLSWKRRVILCFRYWPCCLLRC